mmetsp:Transcript_44202/g.84501  ORF Transcript_44202/g.84501 Transcript_44202/m.84501 type:complete len:229 (-) Transcript_44202:191-877(-)
MVASCKEVREAAVDALSAQKRALALKGEGIRVRAAVVLSGRVKLQLLHIRVHRPMHRLQVHAIVCQAAHVHQSVGRHHQDESDHLLCVAFFVPSEAHLQQISPRIQALMVQCEIKCTRLGICIDHGYHMRTVRAYGNIRKFRIVLIVLPIKRFNPKYPGCIVVTNMAALTSIQNKIVWLARFHTISVGGLLLPACTLHALLSHASTADTTACPTPIRNASAVLKAGLR